MNIKEFIVVALKGFGMGAANVVPGVSGGTIALLTGIYSRIVETLDSLTNKATWKALASGQFKEFWRLIGGNFLLALATGVLVSIVSLAKLVTVLLTSYPVLVWAFFFGLIIASLVLMFKDLDGIKGIADIAMALIGLGLGLGMCFMSPTSTTDDLWFIFVCGAVSICTMILPGVSGSFVLLILSKYEYIMQAISELNVPVLITFAAGCVIGLLAFAKLLNWLLKRWERQTMLVLMGFVIGSMVRIWPWYDMDAVREAQLLRTGTAAATVDLQIPGAIICMVAGIALVTGIDFFSRRK